MQFSFHQYSTSFPYNSPRILNNFHCINYSSHSTYHFEFIVLIIHTKNHKEIGQSELSTFGLAGYEAYQTDIEWVKIFPQLLFICSTKRWRRRRLLCVVFLGRHFPSVQINSLSLYAEVGIVVVFITILDVFHKLFNCWYWFLPKILAVNGF